LQLSAAECTVSASSEAEPVTRNAASFVAAMPRLAPNAARIALVLPSSSLSASLMPGLLASGTA
jgi:hypothetical protein